jgi:hypothetical protein
MLRHKVSPPGICCGNVALEKLVSLYVRVLLAASFHQSSVRTHCTELNPATAQLTTNNPWIDERRTEYRKKLHTIMQDTTFHMQTL